MTKEKLTFRVDTGWFTDFVRNRVYYEGVPFDEGVKLITSCLSGVSEGLAISVLNGTKRFQGVNTAEVVDDNSTAEYLKYLQWLDQISKLNSAELDLSTNPLKYLDPFTTVRSISKYKEKCDSKDEAPSLYTMRKWFQEFCPNDELFEGGLYSVSTKFAKRPIRTEKDESDFYEDLYDYWNKKLGDGGLSEEDEKKIKLRQRKYELYKEKKEKGSPSTEELLEELKDKKGNELKPDEFYELNSYKLSTVYKEDNSKYMPMPEGEFTRYGLISPNGDFYSCDFGSHASAALYLCNQLSLLKTDDIDKAKDELYHRGWVFVYSGGNSYEPFFSKWGSKPEDFPKKQFDTAYGYIIWEEGFK